MGKITAVDRFIFTLIFAAIIHFTILFGVSFDASSPPTNQPRVNLEITLVKHQTELAPEEADYLAQANNEGGGVTEEKSPEPTPDAPIPVAEEQASAPAIIPIAPVVPQKPAKPTPPEPTPVPPQPVEKPPAKSTKIITQAKAERKVETTIETTDEIDMVVKEVTKPKLSASDLIFQAKSEIIRLENQLDSSTKALSKNPKKRRISAATKEYASAAYREAWRKKVERIGNINYPQEAKRQRINGSLMLSVDINPDGSVPPDGIVISRGSGHKVLDDAAIKIVRLGAPYATIPENVLQDHDMITIIRTWRFETDQGLLSK
ncbi:MAG: energy transducer TonB [Methylophagaceae bacterium]